MDAWKVNFLASILWLDRTSVHGQPYQPFIFNKYNFEHLSPIMLQVVPYYVTLSPIMLQPYRLLNSFCILNDK